MFVLAFDTTSEHGGAAIYQDGQCLATAANQGSANYSVNLFQLVEGLLQEVKTRQAAPLESLRDIDLFAVANGPGSFTGIRVGLAAALGWSNALGRPVRGVSVLEALVEEAHPEADWVVPTLDARRGEFFLGVFQRLPQKNGGSRFSQHGEGLVLESENVVTFLERFLREESGGGTVACLAREPDRAAHGLEAHLPKSVRWQSVPGPLLGAMARLALAAHSEGKPLSITELDAYYIRRADAELNWKE